MDGSTMAESKKKPARKVRGWKIALRILKVLRVPLLCLIGLFAGLAAGYAYFGGRPLYEVFTAGPWKHMFDLIFAKT